MDLKPPSPSIKLLISCLSSHRRDLITHDDILDKYKEHAKLVRST